MIWNKKPHDDKYRSWYAYYNLLPAYLAEKQHLWIPCDYKTADGVPLGIWAKQQRYKRARKDKTRQAQVMLLDEIGFLWTPLREENKKPERHLFTFTCIDGGTSTWRDEMGGRFRVAGYVSLPS
jgi:Helicase associated domain